MFIVQVTYHRNYFRIIKAHRMTVQFRFLFRKKLLVCESHSKYHNERNTDHSVNHVQKEIPMIIVANTIV